MKQSPLQCCTSIIRSSVLVQNSSSLSMGRTRAGPRGSLHQKFHFRHLLARVFIMFRIKYEEAIFLNQCMLCVFLYQPFSILPCSSRHAYSAHCHRLSLILLLPYVGFRIENLGFDVYNTSFHGDRRVVPENVSKVFGIF